MYRLLKVIVSFLHSFLYESATLLYSLYFTNSVYQGNSGNIGVSEGLHFIIVNGLHFYCERTGVEQISVISFIIENVSLLSSIRQQFEL